MADKNAVFDEIREEHLDMMIKLALKQAESEGLLDNEDYSNEIVTDEEMQRTYNLFLEKLRIQNEQKAKEERKRKCKNVIRSGTRVLVCLIIFLALATPIALANIAPLREYVARMLISQQADHTEVQLVIDKELVPAGWKGQYYPARIPNGYSFVTISEYDNMSVYMDSEDNMFYYRECTDGETVNLDSEGANLRYEMINTVSALILEEDGFVTITWNNNERMFVISGYMSVEEAKRVMVSVRRITT